jgi:gamma-glutamylcyclotransferase (GGCT)/AIG2-like uncharacterized protein YtfP
MVERRSMSKKFFVYGTLKVGGKLAESFDETRETVVKAVLPGHDLFNLGWFPGIKPGEGAVHGEVHTYKRDVTDHFDTIEGYNKKNEENSLYLRRTVTVKTEDGEVEAEAYVFNRGVYEESKIETGVWPV